MQRGFTLSYQGRLFSAPSQKNHSGDSARLDALKENFGEIGALAIRYTLGLGQRAALIQQIVRDDYEANPIEMPASGNNQPDIFAHGKSASVVRRETKMLEACSHYSLGRGKFNNERVQPVAHHNSEDLRGELYFWETMHAAVWRAGIDLSYQLAKQGFVYVICPADLTKSEYDDLSAELASGSISLQEGEENPIAVLRSGRTLQTASLPSLSIQFDPAHEITGQENGLLICVNRGISQMGWILHTQKKAIIETEYTEHLLRFMRIAKGGFHALSQQEQALLQTGMLKGTGQNLFTQNQTFNAMLWVFAALEKEFDFDASMLMPDKNLHLSFRRISDTLSNPENEFVEDFLTGILITEMVQPLMRTQLTSARSALPMRFTNRFEVILNNAKAIAYGFEMKNHAGQPIVEISRDTTAIELRGEFIDAYINGQLRLPELINPKHAASLIATALLVAQQVLLEQILRDAVKHGDEHPHAQTLKAIINNKLVYQQLIAMAQAVPANEFGPILGLQFTYCDGMVAVLRETLKFDINNLAGFVDALHTHGYQSIKINDDHLMMMLSKLFEVGERLQELEATSVRAMYSRGINAGLGLVIAKLAPDLYRRLNVEASYAIAHAGVHPPLDAALAEDACPFLRSVKPEQLVVPKQTRQTWCQYFAKNVVPVGVSIGVAAAYIAYECVM